MGADPGEADGADREVGGAVVEFDADPRFGAEPVAVGELGQGFPRDFLHIRGEEVGLGFGQDEGERREIEDPEPVQLVQQVERVLDQGVERVAPEGVPQDGAALVHLSQPEQVLAEQARRRRGIRTEGRGRPGALRGFPVAPSPLGRLREPEVESRVTGPQGAEAALRFGQPLPAIGEEEGGAERGEGFGGLRQERRRGFGGGDRFPRSARPPAAAGRGTRRRPGGRG